MLTEIDIRQMTQHESDAMPNRATVMVASFSQNASGQTRTTYTPDAYSEDLAIPCRVFAGMPSDEVAWIATVEVNTQVWTITFPAGTEIKTQDRVWVKGKPKAYGVRAIADGGDYETGVVAICVEAPF